MFLDLKAANTEYNLIVRHSFSGRVLNHFLIHCWKQAMRVIQFRPALRSSSNGSSCDHGPFHCFLAHFPFRNEAREPVWAMRTTNYVPTPFCASANRA